MCTHMCVYIYIYIYAYTCVYTYTYIYIYIYIYRDAKALHRAAEDHALPHRQDRLREGSDPTFTWINSLILKHTIQITWI